MKISKYISIIVLVASMSELTAQQVVPAQVLDKLTLEADEYRGTIQWEFSLDGLSWSDVLGGNTSPFEVTVDQFPSYYRARIEEEDCDSPHFSEIIEVVNSAEVKFWSDPNTWGSAGKPTDEDEVTIPPGETIYLDENTADLAGLTIEGTLQFSRLENLNLTADHIFIHDGGLLRIGTEAEPFEQKATITLNGTNTSENVNTRGITITDGGLLDIHGATPEVIWTKIDAHVELGDNQIELQEAAQWPLGAEIVLAPTDYYRAGNGISITQKFTILEVNEKTLTVDHPSQANVWGVLQYVSETGVSLNAADMIAPPSEGVPTIIDERAEIGLLSRNIVIQSPDDDLWKNEGFGVHTMTMKGGISRFEGVEFKRGGQSGRLQRYPSHHHMWNVAGDGGGNKVYVDMDVDQNQYVKKSSVHTSMNRGFVIHGSWNIELSDNVIFDTRGHGIFLEDGSERQNTISHNLVLHVRDPETSVALMAHESTALNGFGSSGIWYSNPDNDLKDNAFADCQTFGIWAAFSSQTWGLSSSVLNPVDPSVIDNPSRTAMRSFSNNIAHSCRLGGIRLDDPQIDVDGRTTGHFYRPTDDGKLEEWPQANNVNFLIEGGTVFKNGGTGVWDRSSRSIARFIVNADNAGRYFAGAGSAGLIEKCLVVSKTANIGLNGTYRPLNTDCAAGRCNQLGTVAFASYHYGFEFDGNVIVGFNLDECEEGERCGTFDFSDLYIRAVEEGPGEFVKNNVLIDSHGGVKLYPPDPYEHFTLSGAVNAKVHGYDDGYFIYNDDFHASGLEIIPVEPANKSGGVIALGGMWSGIRGFILDDQNEFYNDFWAIEVKKYELLENSKLSELGSSLVHEAPSSDALLNHMRDAALNDTFVYTLDFPDDEAPQTFTMLVDNLIDENHIQIIGIEFDTGNPPSEVFMSSWSNGEPNSEEYIYTEVDTFEEVVNSKENGTEGRVWWLDTESNRVWAALKGGDWEFYTNPEQATPEDRLYETIEFHMR